MAFLSIFEKAIKKTSLAIHVIQGDFDMRKVFEVLLITIGAELPQLMDLLNNMRMTLY